MCGGQQQQQKDSDKVKNHSYLRIDKSIVTTIQLSVRFDYDENRFSSQSAIVCIALHINSGLYLTLSPARKCVSAKHA